MKVKSPTRCLQKSWLSLAIAAVLVGGCGGTGQDDGSPSTTVQEFGGSVIDGYLARASVFLDTNNNGTRDAWEPSAFTDNDGFYSYNPRTDTDYCADEATEQQQQYCLESAVTYEDVVVRVDGGYDVLTGEPFLGQMTRRVEVAGGEIVTDALVSPITSRMTSARTEEEKAAMLDALGLQESDLDRDYINSDGTGTVDAALLNKALTIHKAVTVLSDKLTDTYDEIGETFGTPNDASAAVYQALADRIADTNDLNAALQPQQLYQVLDVAEEALRSVYERKELNLPADMGSPEQPGGFARVAEVVSDIPPVVDALIDENDPNQTESDVTGKARALEALVIKAVNETTVDNTIENAVAFFTNENNEPLIGALVESLEGDDADVDLLSANDFSGPDFDSVLEVAQSSSVPASAQPITQVGGLQLRLADLDLGVAPDRLDDNEIEFYFNGAAADTDGSFTACVKIVSDANEDGTLGEGSTRGELADGFWSKLGGSDADGSTYNLLMTLNFLGATYQGIIKVVGKETIGGVEYHAIRFDNDGKLETWHSQLGFSELGDIPDSSAACEARLPSRVGI
ncbi:MAG: hypothetical protein AAF404_09430 [Pseudomonadota bacterium]